MDMYTKHHSYLSWKGGGGGGGGGQCHKNRIMAQNLFLQNRSVCSEQDFVSCQKAIGGVIIILVLQFSI